MSLRDLAPALGLVVYSYADVTEWVLLAATETETVEVACGRAEETINDVLRDRLMLEAVDAASELALAQQSVVNLVIFKNSIRERLLNVGEEFGGTVHVVRRSGIAYLDDDKFSETMAALRSKLRPEPAAELPADVVVVATDGAFSAERGGGAYGWVTSAGIRGSGQAKVTSALQAELVAIYRALTSAADGSEVRVLTDSKMAIAAIGETSSLSSRTLALVRKIHRQRNRLSFELEWVKGHAGHPMNDAADRLARLARTSKLYGTPRSAVHEIEQNIVCEMRLAS